jgi:hydrogenase maturation protein HypF
MLEQRRLPRAQPHRVLACGAWLKNTACLLQGDTVWWSPVHGDLGEPGAREALDASVRALLAQANGPLHAVAHDLHPDFHSTHLALQLAREHRVPAVAVQHHHAHITVVQATQGLAEPVIGLALDGVGLGTDGVAWGGELLWVDAAGGAWQRLGHLHPLALPGGDAAAREPWRMAAAALHALGRGPEIEARFGPVVGASAARLLAQMLDKQLNCPPSTGAGRWFDAAAGALGLSVKQSMEAEAAIALEKAATLWLESHPAPAIDPALQAAGLDLRPLLARLFPLAAGGDEARAEGAALFHVALASALARAAIAAASERGCRTVALGGGCFFNRLLTQRLTQALQAAGLAVHLPQATNVGDAGLALGQAWAAAAQLAPPAAAPQHSNASNASSPQEPLCA